LLGGWLGRARDIRAGIAQLIPIEKRGNAYASLTPVYGVLWFLGSVTMMLYDYSLVMLVVSELFAAWFSAMFVWCSAPRAARVD